ncbi:MAG: hypothetical protein L7H18_00470 [Candidatus Nealsonbacteria bacterium DGGOD1a]|jgi:uncharacterized protein with PQ loop repeat|nr:MAG: hypothetical protein L7H18_00470 [Candidatus Nealsonbacteria bacterium DGGOD1a]
MQDILIQALTLAYGSTGIVGVAAYWPTIKDLWRGKPSANVSSYFIWVATNGITWLYGLLILKDAPFIFVSSLYLFANGLTLFMRLRLRKK